MSDERLDASSEESREATSGPGPGQESAAEPSGWRRLRRALRPRPSRYALVVALLAALLGVGISTQIGQTRQEGLENLRQSELVGILDSVRQRSNRLDEEITRLTQERDRLQREQGLDPAQAREAATSRADALGILAGTLPARGPGVRIAITDASSVVGSANLLDAIQELRDAGAEAIQVGDVRVVASSYVTEDSGGGLLVDGRSLPASYAVLAIGDPQTLASAMDIPGGVVETIRGVGATIDVTQTQDLAIDSLHAPAAPRYARPESNPSSTTPPG